jgi:hypothetical protein
MYVLTAMAALMIAHKMLIIILISVYVGFSFQNK